MTVSETDGADRVLIEALLEPGEAVVRAAPAAATMQYAGIVALAWAVPVLAVGWVPLHRVAGHLKSLQGGSPLPLLLFGGFGLLFVAIGLRLLLEPWRLHRLYPHVVHVLTDRRFLEIDRRSGVLHVSGLGDIWQMKIFSPFGRLTLWRRRFDTGTGKLARVRNFDGVRDVAAVAQAIAERTGVPVGLGRAAVAASIAAMPPERRGKLR